MSQRVFSIIARHSNELVSKLRFVPLGLLWGLVAGSLASYRYISSPYRYISSPSGLLRFDVDVSPDWWRLELIFVPIMGAVASSLLIALLLGSALLNRKSSSIRWLCRLGDHRCGVLRRRRCSFRANGSYQRGLMDTWSGCHLEHCTQFRSSSLSSSYTAVLALWRSGY